MLSLERNTFFGETFQSEIWPSAITCPGSRAIKDILFREIVVPFAMDEKLAFVHAGGGESPT